MFKKLYLPVGMIIAVILSFLCPEPGTWFKALRLSSWLTMNNFLIVVIFLVCGWNMDVSSVKFDRKFALLFASGAVFSLLVSPLLGWGTAKVFCMGVLPATGLIVAAAMPPTLSSGIVLTETANGSTLLAILMTVGYNLLSVITIPLMLALCVTSGGQVDTNPLRMFIQLVMLVLLPSIIGFVLKKWTKRKLPKIFGYAPSTAVILLIWGFFSASSAEFKEHSPTALLQEGASALVLHGILLAVMWYGGLLFKCGKAERKALLFTGGSKTITIAITMLNIIGAGTGAAMVPCLVYYFVQSLVDSALAGKMGLSALKEGEKAQENAVS